MHSTQDGKVSVLRIEYLVMHVLKENRYAGEDVTNGKKYLICALLWFGVLAYMGGVDLNYVPGKVLKIP